VTVDSFASNWQMLSKNYTIRRTKFLTFFLLICDITAILHGNIKPTKTKMNEIQEKTEETEW
jgi:hypothetical protein